MIVAALGSSFVVAQEPVREFCRDADSPDMCPVEDCPCVDDTLEMVFEGQLDSSNYELDVLDPDEIIRGRVVLDTVSPDARAYSFGVRHDAALVNPMPGSLGLNVDRGPNRANPPTARDAAFHGGLVALREERKRRRR